MERQNSWFNRQSLSHPVLVWFILLLIALLFRIIDIFILRLDDILGEIILSKSLGFVLIVVYLYLAGKSLTCIGLNKHKAGQAFFIGGVGMLLIFIAAWLAHFVNNTILNFIYIQMDGELHSLLSISRQEFIVLLAIYFIGLFLLVLWANHFSRRFKMQPVEPWNNS